jgi:adenosylhomocysteine nucleosidase
MAYGVARAMVALTINRTFDSVLVGGRPLMSKVENVVAVTCLELEAYIARGPRVSVICNQGTELKTALAAAVTGASGIISFGIAGGLAPDLRAGDWVVASEVKGPDRVVTTDRAWSHRLLEALPGAVHARVIGAQRVIATPEEKASLFSQTGAAAVDMESHIAAEIATAHRIPFAACRVILDSANRVVPPAAVAGLRADGTPNISAVIRSALKMPNQLPDLIRTAFDAYIAARALSLGRQRLNVGLEFPHFNDIALDFVAA